MARLGIIATILLVAGSIYADDCCVGRVGDANGEGIYPDEVTLGDIMLMVDAKFISGDCSKLPCLAEADVNQDGGADPNCDDHITLGDIMTLVDFLFITGPDVAVLRECLTPPVLTTAAVSGITETTAECGGTITSDGGATVTVRGVCWSTNPDPTVADSKTSDGAGIGTFVSSIVSLTANTSYCVRAYATNSVGTSYGNVQTFTTGAVTDIDGNVYHAVTIGTQVWMLENLKVTHYRNGDAIPNVTDNGAWYSLTTGAYCNYYDDEGYVATYGRLYNWYATVDSRNIAPAGWHVPTDAEWQILVDYLGGDAVAGGKMKETGTTHWNSPNTGATNESGFAALPGGSRSNDGTYGYLNNYASLWSSTEQSSTNAWDRTLSFNNTEVGRNYLYRYKQNGFSVRCVKD
jgi:uncharacterized protein (TIGR02145 family)